MAFNSLNNSFRNALRFMVEAESLDASSWEEGPTKKRYEKSLKESMKELDKGRQAIILALRPLCALEE